MEGEKESVLPSVGEERLGGAYILRNEREGDEKDDDTANVITRENARPGVGAIRSQSRESRIWKKEDELRLDFWIQIRSTDGTKESEAGQCSWLEDHQDSVEKP